MPDVIAKYGNVTALGRSAEDRKLWEMSFGSPPSQNIRAYMPGLANLMDTWKAHQRSAYACAEADALAALLGKLGNQANIRHNEFEFGVAKSDEGKVLWQPCDNCSKWLDEGRGFGPERTYRLNSVALATLR